MNLISYYIKPYLGRIVFISILFALYSIFQAMTLAGVYPLINSILNNSFSNFEANTPFFIKPLIELSQTLPFSDPIISIAALTLILALLGELFGLLATSLSIFDKYKLYKIYMDRGYSNLLEKKPQYFIQNKQGELIYSGLHASEAVGDLFHFGPLTIAEFFKVISISTVLALTSPKITLFLIVCAAIVVFFYYILSSKFIYPKAEALRETQEKYTSFFSETLAGIRQIKYFQAMPLFEKRYREVTTDFKKHSIAIQLFSILPVSLSRSFGMIAILAAIVAIKSFSPESFKQATPVLAIFLMGIQRLLPALSNLGSNWIGIKSILPKLENVYHRLNQENETDSKHLPKCPVLKNNIELKNLSFSYPDTDNKLVLDKLNLKIDKNKTVAIVGSSGAGKSTLADILTGFYEPTEGQILIDGQDLKDYSLTSWQQKVSIVSQDPFIFHLSAKDNIKIGKIDSSDEEINNVLSLSHSEGFVDELPSKLETILGERGSKLSGGQKQRISIARALLKNPDLLILDEATSALDNISEKIFQENMNRLMGKYTMVVISHRLSTVVSADVIAVVEEGKIIEQGTHQELLAKQGAYSKLYASLNP